MQGVFLESEEAIEGRRVMRESWDPADQFVLEHVAGGIAVTGNPEQIARGANPDDLLILQSSAEGGWILTTAR